MKVVERLKTNYNYHIYLYNPKIEISNSLASSFVLNYLGRAKYIGRRKVKVKGLEDLICGVFELDGFYWYNKIEVIACDKAPRLKK